jgi:hypothetical protein
MLPKSERSAMNTKPPTLNLEAFEIEHGIPIPPKKIHKKSHTGMGGGKGRTGLFRALKNMGVGCSMLLTKTQADAARTFSDRDFANFKITSRKVDETWTRIWRIQ